MLYLFHSAEVGKTWGNTSTLSMYKKVRLSIIPD